MTAPTNMEEFRQRSADGNALTGEGAMTFRHIPCPFCAAPGFATIQVIVWKFGLDGVRSCRECERSARVEDPTAETIVWLQVAGDDPPSWLEPKIRREP